MADDLLLTCYNKGCGKKYKESENNEAACSYHPGEPFFRDSYKGWTCCNKKSIDFSTFLSLSPCTQGFHSNVKAAVPAKPNIVLEKVTSQPPPIEPQVIENIEEQFIELPIKVSNQCLSSLPSTTTATVSNKDDVRRCSNAGCDKTENDSDDLCVYHPGKPVFHEGMKYWSCCQQKTTDFSAFIGQRGCTRGTHLFLDNQPISTELDCKIDMYQIGSDCVVSIFAKAIVPDTCKIVLNAMAMRISFESTQGMFNKEFRLFELVKPNLCKAVLLPSKLEITLRKVNPSKQWPKLIKN